LLIEAVHLQIIFFKYTCNRLLLRQLYIRFLCINDGPPRWVTTVLADRILVDWPNTFRISVNNLSTVERVRLPALWLFRATLLLFSDSRRNRRTAFISLRAAGARLNTSKHFTRTHVAPAAGLKRSTAQIWTIFVYQLAVVYNGW